MQIQEEQILQHIIGTDGVTIMGVIGSVRPPVDIPVSYSCLIYNSSKSKELIVRFGIRDSSGSCAYRIVDRRIKPAPIGEDIGKFSIALPSVIIPKVEFPLKHVNWRSSQKQSIVTWAGKPPIGEYLNFQIDILFESKPPAPKSPCQNHEFNLILDVEVGASFFHRFILPESATRALLLPIVPILQTSMPQSERIVIRNTFGYVRMGEIRQVSFRAESIGYFLRYLLNLSPEESTRIIMEVTQEISSTWLSQVEKVRAINEVTPENWAYYDSWAGLGQIFVTRIPPDRYSVTIADPFTSEWTLPDKLHALFWEGYVRGIFEGISGIRTDKIDIKGDRKRWTLEIKMRWGFA